MLKLLKLILKTLLTFGHIGTNRVALGNLLDTAYENCAFTGSKFLSSHS